MLPVLVALSLVLAGGGPAGAGVEVVAPADKKLDEAAARLRRALASGAREERAAALDGVVALESAGGVSVIQAEYARASQRLRTARDEHVEKTYVLERKREALAVARIRAERDAGLQSMVERARMDVAELEAGAASARRDAERWSEACDAFAAATTSLFERFGPGKARKALGLLWKDVEEHPAYGVRIAAGEMLGRVGGPGTTLRLHRVMAKVHGERLARKRQLPKLEEKVRKFEARFQRELDRNGGRPLRGTPQEYARIKAEPARIRGELHRMAFLVDAAAEAAGRALSREGVDLDRTLASLVRLQRRAAGGLRVLTLDVLRNAEGEAVLRSLRRMLEAEKEPLIRAEIIDALAELGDSASISALIATHLSDGSWHVRSRAAAALATLRSREAIPALIERLDLDRGRMLTDCTRALQSLTGERFGASPQLWRRWWKDHGADFEVPVQEPGPRGSLSAMEAVGVTFFGIRTESQRVLFVLDVSRSMNFSMVPRTNPDDDPGRPPDMPEPGEDSRLDVARRQLRKALGGIRDGGVINVVLYATDVHPLYDELVEVDQELRSELAARVDALTANGGTNIYGAMKVALDLAGAEEGDEWSAPAIDTIYLLTDGRASAGVTTDADEILAYVRERNRAAGITIHTIGLSGAQDAYLLRSLAEQSGGVYAAR